jgi:hypothetical protein
MPARGLLVNDLPGVRMAHLGPILEEQTPNLYWLNAL